MICRNCKKPLPNNSVFCLYCGEKQEVRKVCPKCGTDVVAMAEYCPSCGSRVTLPDNRTSAANRPAGTKDSMFSVPDNTAEPFYKKWIAEHRQLAENKRITWISEFKGGYAVAIDDRAPGRELRPFLVRGENTAETVCYMSWTGANLSNGVLPAGEDCFRNGTRYLSFILFKSNSMVSPTEYVNILRAFTGITQAYATSGLVLLLSRSGQVTFAAQYQENVTGIADIFPLRVIGGKYCLYTSPDEYNKMTNRERYNASSYEMKTASQDIIDCDTGETVIGSIFVPKYEGDPSEYFVEFFSYDDNIADNVLRITSEKEKYRCIFNRKTGTVYVSDENTRYKAVRVTESGSGTKYLMAKTGSFTVIRGHAGDTYSGASELVNEDDQAVITLGRYDTEYSPEIVAADKRLYVSMRSPEVSTENGEVSCENNITEISCFVRQNSSVYGKSTSLLLKNGGGFTEGLVRYHRADKTESCYGCFNVAGKTYIAVLKEKERIYDDNDICMLLNDELREIYSFAYKQHYGDQAPYGIHIFDDVIYSLSCEQDDMGGNMAVMKNISTGETMFSVPSGQLIANASAEFGTSRISPKYEFGSYRINGQPCFLVGKQNRALGIIDIHGSVIIPTDGDNYFIVSSDAVGMIGDGKSYARLPKDMFLVVLESYDSDMYRLCDAEGETVFEGNLSELTARFV